MPSPRVVAVMNNSQAPVVKPIPFARNPDTTALFQATAQQEALARLQLMVQRRFFGVLTGEVGSGKSTLIRYLVGSLDQMRY